MAASKDRSTQGKQLPDFDLVLFGGTGDLAMRKLLPALFRRYLAGQFPAHARIVSVARSSIERDDYLAQVEESSKKYLPAGLDATRWTTFSRSLDYIGVDATNASDYQKLAAKLANNPAAVRVFFLSTAPALFQTICRNLASAQLVTPGARVVLEKPLGQDRASAATINENVGEIFPERQIYRIDHYLGKEAVQNLLALRFGNSLFEPLWRRGRIRHVQITVAEELGVEGRGAFYDQTGALRDMVQNHMLQLLCIMAMEPPVSNHPDAVRDEKLKVLRALKPLEGADVGANVVRGQYRAGAVKGAPVVGYLEERGIPPDSTTETYVAIKAHIDTWRWAGVPFYLRTGKRLGRRVTEIALVFKRAPHLPFDATMTDELGTNAIVIRVQPDEGITLRFGSKVPGSTMEVRDVNMDFSYGSAFAEDSPEAYERLILDVLLGEPSLFPVNAEVELAWQILDPVLDYWSDHGKPDPYESGTWGPDSAFEMLRRTGREWRRP